MIKRKVIKNRNKFPVCIRNFTVLRGISIGKCVDSSTIKNSAHAHTEPIDPFHGWICLKYRFQLKEKFLLLHEIAHLLAPVKTHHGKAWQKIVVKIGGTTKPFISKCRRKNKWEYPGYNKLGRQFHYKKNLTVIK